MPADELPADFASRLPKDVPVFLYHNQDDDIVPFSHLALYAKRIPRATVRQFDTGGHQFNNDLAAVAADMVGTTAATTTTIWTTIMAGTGTIIITATTIMTTTMTMITITATTTTTTITTTRNTTTTTTITTGTTTRRSMPTRTTITTITTTAGAAAIGKEINSGLPLGRLARDDDRFLKGEDEPRLCLAWPEQARQRFVGQHGLEPRDR